MARELKIRDFDIREAYWDRDSDTLSTIRKLVFIVEQGVPREEEWDGRDDASWHWLATGADGKPIGTARLLPDGQIGRMAVLADYRGLGVGAALLERACDKARYLGFSTVFLNAQTHALSFYERAGFVPEGPEFQEAGIAHRRMTRQFETGHGSNPVALARPDMALRSFDAAEVDWANHGKIIRKIRESVFVLELGLPADFRTDEEDEKAFHWQAVSPDGQVVGSVRMNLEGTISRLAVLAEFRHQGIGMALLELAISKARRFGFDEVRMSTSPVLDSFCRLAGFLPSGPPQQAAGQRYQPYEKPLTADDPFDRPRSPLSGDAYLPQDATYRLGKDNQLILVRKETEFRNIILEMCAQARQSIRIFSPVLEHKLFDRPELRQVCSALARRNKYTRIEILLYDSHRVVKNGHALLEIARKLPSSIGMKIVDPELRQLNHEYVLADDSGLIYRHDYEAFDGYANFNDIAEANRLGRAFTAAWESGQVDPNLRLLRI